VFGDVFRGKLTPQAAFDAMNIAGLPPLSVTFRNRSWQGDESYSWNFGDGQSSTDRDPTHVYTNAGTYSVTLTVTGPGGSQSVETKHKLIRVGSVTSAEAVDPGVPAEFRLSGGYPNPFNGIVNFELHTAETGLVTVRVYDLLGRLVAVLANGEFKPGYHSLQWNSGNAASGVYLVRMEAGTFSVVQRIVLAK
jgi:PKD repeat protein